MRKLIEYLYYLDKKLHKKTLRNTIPFIFVRIYHENVIERI